MGVSRFPLPLDVFCYGYYKVAGPISHSLRGKSSHLLKIPERAYYVKLSQCVSSLHYCIPIFDRFDTQPKKIGAIKRSTLPITKTSFLKMRCPKEEEEETLSSKFGCSVTGWLLRLPAIKLKFPRGVTVSL